MKSQKQLSVPDRAGPSARRSFGSGTGNRRVHRAMTVSAAVSAVLAACAHASALAAPLQQADQASAPTESRVEASMRQTRDFAEGTASIDPSKPISFRDTAP